jgi:glycosyltransferase involved in cell wall biosynthesis
VKTEHSPPILVYSSLFPHRGQPNAGVFIRERMFRVARELPMVVVVPVPWFPLQGILRYFRPHFRPAAPRYERQSGVDVYFPRYLCFPGIFKQLDGILMALGTYRTVRRLKQERSIELIDSHFAYPDGYAAVQLGKWLELPVTITLRGTELRMSKSLPLLKRMLQALEGAIRIFSVADSLRQLMGQHGADTRKIIVVGNGVDTNKFEAVPRDEARKIFGLKAEDKALISIGGLVPRKGYHRVIEVLPELVREFPSLKYLIVGGPGPEGDYSQVLREQVSSLGLDDHVLFLGPKPSEELKFSLSAADVFVLATENEGWANVFLEAMACGLPVVTTRVGGNAEVVANKRLGSLVEFGNSMQLREAIEEALNRVWEKPYIVDYARSNSWNGRVETLVSNFCELTSPSYGTCEG